MAEAILENWDMLLYALAELYVGVSRNNIEHKLYMKTLPIRYTEIPTDALLRDKNELDAHMRKLYSHASLYQFFESYFTAVINEQNKKRIEATRCRDGNGQTSKILQFPKESAS